MAATYKSAVLARQLAEVLSIRLGLTTVEGRDASGNPTISIGTLAAASQSAFIRIKQDYDPALELDGIGNVQRRYTPHVVQVVLEMSTITNVPLMTIANLTKLMGELAHIGAKVEIYLSANTAPVAVGEIVSGNLKVTFDDLWHPLTSTI